MLIIYNMRMCNMCILLVSVIDLRVIRAAIDWIFESIDPSSEPNIKIKALHRSDATVNDQESQELTEEIARQERLRSGLTTIVGAVMQKQNCWDRAACTIGSYLMPIQAKDVLFM